MKTIHSMAALGTALFIVSGLLLREAKAQQADGSHTDLRLHELAALPFITAAAGTAHGAPIRETVTVAANELIPNIPGKRLVSHVVDYPPGASSAAHRHAPSAFIYAYVVAGAIRSQVDGDPARIYKVGEGWFENPGAHHRVSANASETEPARLLAVLIVDEADEPLVVPDR